MKSSSRRARLSPSQLQALSLLSEPGKRTVFLQRHRNLVSHEVVEQLHAAAQSELRIDSRRALALAEAAIAIAEKLRKRTALAQSLRMKANVLSTAGEDQEALSLYNTALQLFEKEGDDEGIARTLTASIQPYILLGEYDKAFDAAKRAKQLFEKLGDDRRLARLENNVGNIYHRQDRFEDALDCYERAYIKLLPYRDSEELTISLNNMSMCLITMNDFPRALATYNRAKELLKERDLPILRLITDYNIAYLYYFRGDYRRSIEMLKAARERGEAIDNRYLQALCYLDLSEIYIELNLSSEAQDVSQESYDRFQKLGMGYEAAKSVANRAIALGQEGKSRQAFELFAQAKPLFVKEKNGVWPWLIDLYQALVLFHEGRHYESRKLCQSAAEFFDSSILKNKAILSHSLLAQLAIRTGETKEARSECQKSLALLESVDAPLLRYQTHFLMGQVEKAEGKSREAFGRYQQARSELENLRSSLGRDELKISFMKNKTELYERLVELCLEGEIENASVSEAFHYIELAKSRSLTELIFQRSHELPEGESGESDLVHRIRDLREELNWYQHRIEQEQLRPEQNSTARLGHLQEEAAAREKSILDAMRDLPSGAAESRALHSQKEVGLDAVQGSLPDGATLIEFFFTGERVLACVIDGGSIEIVPVTLVSRAAELLRFFRFQLSKFRSASPLAKDLQNAGYEATLFHLQELYEELIAPIRHLIGGSHIVFVPHGFLHYLPLHALHDGDGFLIDSYTVSYAPSAGVYTLCHNAPDNSGGDSLVLGIPDSLAPSIQEEAERVSGILPNAKLFMGDAADHDVLRRHARNCKWIHIATHGNFRQDNPMFSGIRLGDSYLHLYELYQLKLSADLLTLSGCATGLNVVVQGDELLGLIRGALYAGARSLLLSLWDVNDRSTTEFMTSFYEELQKKGNKAESLSAALRKVRDVYPHPYYWAPFVLVGKALSS